jgi:methionyl-tRNA synthetase
VEISYEEFMTLDLRVGQVISAEAIPKSRNLLKLMVDLGEETLRQIIAGISNEYQSTEMVGKKVVVLANLKPRKLMGMESQGMLLAADVENRAVLLKVDEKYIEKVKPGTKIR